MSRGACLHADPELFFPAATGVTGAGQAQGAKEVWAVRAACLAYALAT
jgi:Transcription factor WhiB